MRAWRLAAAAALPGALLSFSAHLSAQSGVVHGFVREAATGEPVVLAAVQPADGASARADRDGYFTLPGLGPGEHRLRVRAVGYATLDTVVAASAAPVTLRLRPAPVELAAVTVQADAPGDRPFDAPEVSVRTVTPAQVRRVPAGLEADVFRSIQALPGVVAPSAFSSRLLVRGGAADQNLFLLDGYPVIHPYHLTGAFSAFHLDAVKDVELWLGAPPARYGGRLSSVVDVALREGNRERTTGAASLGLVSSAAVVEGPHARGAWFAGLRATYLDLVTGTVGNEVPYRFADGYAKAYADLSAADRVSALLFVGRDDTWRAESLDPDNFHWVNEVYGVSWRRLLGGRGVLEHRASLSRFSERLDAGYSTLQGTSIVTDHALSLASLRGDLRLDLGRRNDMEAGWSVERRTGDHLVRYLEGEAAVTRAERVSETGRTLVAGYLQDDLSLSSRLRVRLGVRGEGQEGAWSVQPRASARYLLGERLALTAGAGLLRQWDHLLQDPDANFDIYTADIWLASGEPGIGPASSTHLVVGTEARLADGIQVRAEAYEKRSRGLITLAPYHPESGTMAIDRLENATGVDRGLDVSLSREGAGPVRGWIGYSLAQASRRVADSVFAADPHPQQRLVAVWDLEPWRKWAMTGRFEVFEGVPFTPAVTMVNRRPFDFARGRFTDECTAVEVEYLYGDRNAARTGWSKRLDLGAGRRWTDRRGRRWELSLSLLNALFNPTGVFRPRAPEHREGCDAPTPVQRSYEVLLPPIPSFSVRVEF